MPVSTRICTTPECCSTRTTQWPAFQEESSCLWSLNKKIVHQGNLIDLGVICCMEKGKIRDTKFHATRFGAEYLYKRRAQPWKTIANIFAQFQMLFNEITFSEPQNTVSRHKNQKKRNLFFCCCQIHMWAVEIRLSICLPCCDCHLQHVQVQPVRYLCAGPGVRLSTFLEYWYADMGKTLNNLHVVGLTVLTVVTTKVHCVQRKGCLEPHEVASPVAVMEDSTLT